MTVPVMMGIDSPTGSHLPALTAALTALPRFSLVIEHGAGLYSTPLFARHDVRVLCAENHPGWSVWARWIYSLGSGAADIVDSFKRLVPRLAEADLVFIDGTAKERGLLLQAALERNVPTIICHDTAEKDWHHYGLCPHHFIWSKYTVTHFAEDTHRTTVWRHA